MINSRKKLIAAVVVIILLVTGIIIFSCIDFSKSENTNNNSDETVYTIISENADSIANIEVTTGEETIKAVNLGETIWTINDMSINDIDSSKAYSLAGTISTLTSKNKIEENPSDLAQYGLANPSTTVKITMKDGKEQSLFIGDSSPVTGEYFVIKEGDNTVYSIYPYKVSTLRQPLSYYQEFNRFSVNIDDICGINIARIDETINIELIDNVDNELGNVWNMTIPYESMANDDYIDNKILEPIQNIVLDSPLNDADGGFSETSTILTLTVKPYDNSSGEYGDIYTEKIIVGKTSGDKTYVKYKGNIFAVSNENIQFVNESSFNIVSKLQALVDITKVSEVTVEYEDERHILSVAHKGSNFDFKLDGEDTDNTAAQQMYQDIISLSVDYVYKGETTGDTVLKLLYKGIGNNSDTVVEFKEINNLNCALIKNGKTEFTIKKSKLTDLISEFKEYLKN